MNAAKVYNYDETINNIQRLLEESKKLDDIYKKKQEILKMKFLTTLWIRKQPLNKRIWWWLTNKKFLTKINPETHEVIITEL